MTLSGKGHQLIDPKTCAQSTPETLLCTFDPSVKRQKAQFTLPYAITMRSFLMHVPRTQKPEVGMLPK
jgi:hypothetical protein